MEASAVTGLGRFPMVGDGVGEFPRSRAIRVRGVTMRGTKPRLSGEWRPLISQNPGRKKIPCDIPTLTKGT